MLKPFWRYYGGKWRAAPKYPAPRYDTIIEPFAGAAGYALRHYERDVVLVEKYHIVAEIWRYLIGADPEQIRSTPSDIAHVDELPDWCPQGLRWLIGFAMNSATVSPCKQLSAGRIKLRDGGHSHTEGWSPAMRERVASQVPHIRHWRVIEGDYRDAPNIEATWYVDPPYSNKAGSYYVHADVDFDALGAWCRSRRGQVIVCEAQGAAWLPFQTFRTIKSFGAAGKYQTSAEAIWLDNDSWWDEQMEWFAQ